MEPSTSSWGVRPFRQEAPLCPGCTCKSVLEPSVLQKSAAWLDQDFSDPRNWGYEGVWSIGLMQQFSA